MKIIDITPFKIFQSRNTYGFSSLSPSEQKDLEQELKKYQEVHWIPKFLPFISSEEYKKARLHVHAKKEAKKNVHRLFRDFSHNQGLKKAQQFAKSQLQCDEDTSQAINKLKIAGQLVQWYEDVNKALRSRRFHALARSDTKHQKTTICSAFTHLPSDAIVHAAQVRLPALAAKFRAYQKELRKKRRWSFLKFGSIPKKFYEDYGTYLDKEIAKITEHQQALAWAMFSRLEAASNRNDVFYDDVTQDIENWLVTNAKEYSCSLPKYPYADDRKAFQRRDLTPEHFYIFHRYIAEHGTQSVKDRLGELKWFKEDRRDTIPVTLLAEKAEYPIAVPQALKSNIPQHSRSPAWLFKGTNFRHYFFEDNAFVLAGLNAAGRDWPQRLLRLRSLGKKVTVRDIKHILREINQITKMADSAKDRAIHAKKNKLLAIFYQRTNRFLNDWLSVLKRSERTLLEKQVEIAEYLVAVVQDANILKLRENLSFAKEIQAFFKNLSHRLHQDPHLDVAIIRRFDTAYKQYKIAIDVRQRFLEKLKEIPIKSYPKREDIIVFKPVADKVDQLVTDMKNQMIGRDPQIIQAMDFVGRMFKNQIDYREHTQESIRRHLSPLFDKQAERQDSTRASSSRSEYEQWIHEVIENVLYPMLETTTDDSPLFQFVKSYKPKLAENKQQQQSAFADMLITFLKQGFQRIIEIGADSLEQTGATILLAGKKSVEFSLKTVIDAIEYIRLQNNPSIWLDQLSCQPDEDGDEDEPSLLHKLGNQADELMQDNIQLSKLAKQTNELIMQSNIHQVALIGEIITAIGKEEYIKWYGACLFDYYLKVKDHSAILQDPFIQQHKEELREGIEHTLMLDEMSEVQITEYDIGLWDVYQEFCEPSTQQQYRLGLLLRITQDPLYFNHNIQALQRVLVVGTSSALKAFYGEDNISRAVECLEKILADAMSQTNVYLLRFIGAFLTEDNKKLPEFSKLSDMFSAVIKSREVAAHLENRRFNNVNSALTFLETKLTTSRKRSKGAARPWQWALEQFAMLLGVHIVKCVWTSNTLDMFAINNKIINHLPCQLNQQKNNLLYLCENHSKLPALYNSLIKALKEYQEPHEGMSFFIDMPLLQILIHYLPAKQRAELSGLLHTAKEISPEGDPLKDVLLILQELATDQDIAFTEEKQALLNDFQHFKQCVNSMVLLLHSNDPQNLQPLSEQMIKALAKKKNSYGHERYRDYWQKWVVRLCESNYNVQAAWLSKHFCNDQSVSKGKSRVKGKEKQPQIPKLAKEVNMLLVLSRWLSGKEVQRKAVVDMYVHYKYLHNLGHIRPSIAQQMTVFERDAVKRVDGILDSKAINAHRRIEFQRLLNDLYMLECADDKDAELNLMAEHALVSLMTQWLQYSEHQLSAQRKEATQHEITIIKSFGTSSQRKHLSHIVSLKQAQGVGRLDKTMQRLINTDSSSWLNYYFETTINVFNIILENYLERQFGLRQREMFIRRRDDLKQSSKVAAKQRMGMWKVLSLVSWQKAPQESKRRRTVDDIEEVVEILSNMSALLHRHKEKFTKQSSLSLKQRTIREAWQLIYNEVTNNDLPKTLQALQKTLLGTTSEQSLSFFHKVCPGFVYLPAIGHSLKHTHSG